MTEIKEEIKPIDIKAEADLHRLKEKYKDQKKEPQKKAPEPEVINTIDTDSIEQELQMINEMYAQSTGRNLTNSAIMSYKMGSMSYQKKHGQSPLGILDKYPFMYFLAFGIFLVTDVIKHLPKKNFKAPTETQSDPLMNEKEVKENIEPVKPIGATEDLNWSFTIIELLWKN